MYHSNGLHFGELLFSILFQLMLIWTNLCVRTDKMFLFGQMTLADMYCVSFA
jgi:hypothetical protein